ncbi:MAG TPA: hypothetical protein VEI97_00770 [bacterium]|nr:hypothetical protein [bacterium]
MKNVILVLFFLILMVGAAFAVNRHSVGISAIPAVGGGEKACATACPPGAGGAACHGKSIAFKSGCATNEGKCMTSSKKHCAMGKQ